MSATEFSIILPALPNKPWAAALSSCLAQEGVEATVTVLIPQESDQKGSSLDPAESALLKGLSVPDTIQVRWVSTHSARDLHSYLALLLSVPAQWVLLLHPDCVLAPNALAQARNLAVAHQASLVVPGTQELTLDGPSGQAAEAIFTQKLASLDPLCLLVDQTTAILSCAALLSPTAHTPVRQSYFFSLCSLAKRVHVTCEPLAGPLIDGASEALCSIQEAQMAATIAQQVARMISQNQRWDALRPSYEVLCQELLEPFAKACFSSACGDAVHNFEPKEGSVALFDSLAALWPMPELLSSLAFWATDHPETLAALALKTNHLTLDFAPLDRILLVTYPGLSLDDSEMAPLRETLSQFAIETQKLQVEASLAAEKRAPSGSSPITSAPKGEKDPIASAHPFPLAVAQKWHRWLREGAPNLLVVPLRNSPELFWGTLMARLAHIPVVAVALSEDPDRAPWTRAISSLASVVALDARCDASAPEHSQAASQDPSSAQERLSASLASAILAARDRSPRVLRSPEEPIALWASRTLDVLEERLSRPSAPLMPSDALLPLFDARLNSRQRTILSAEQTAAQLEERVEILKARLAASRSEAAMLRRRLAEAQGLTGEPRTPNCPLSPRDEG